MQRLVVMAMLLALVGLVRPTSVPAYSGWEGDIHRFHEHDLALGWEGNIHRFHEHDLALWQRGHWFHGRYGSRFGWWWVVGGLWYWYPAPIYPYPDPYTPPVVVQVPTTPAVPPHAQAPSWYYCAQPEGYYPYIAACPGGWQTVPATPSPAAPVPPPAAGQRR
jgi:hypothetical protein